MKELIPKNHLQKESDIFYQTISNTSEMDEIIQRIENIKELYHTGTTVTKHGEVNMNLDFKNNKEIILDNYIDNIEVRKIYDSLSKLVVEFVGNIITNDEFDSAKWLSGCVGHNGKFRIKKYDKGEGFYDWHLDTGGDDRNRLLTVLLYMNTVDEGGETEFSNQNCFIKPKAGTLLAFPPYWNYPHRSNKTISDHKYILAMFVDK